MNPLSSLTTRLAAGTELTADEVEAAASALAVAGVPGEDKAAFLCALADKGETAAELAFFADSFRRRAIDPGVGAWAPRAIDIVGTGGDQAGGFNVSSLVTLVLACAGVPVMKHGNRAITSKCGSADLFGALGVDLQASPDTVRAGLARLGFAFFLAPAWHPAFREIGPVRQALAKQGRRTVFNTLGPLLNPGRPAHILLGAATPAIAERLALALERLGIGAGLAVHGILEPGRGIDELTSTSPNFVQGVGRLRDTRATWTPEEFGLVRAPFSDIAGGDVATNLALTRALADGGGPRGLADTIAFNAAVGLWVVGARPSVRESIGEARDLLLGGAVRRKIADTKEFFAV